MNRKTWVVCVLACALGVAGGFAVAGYQARQPERIRSAFHILYHQLGDQTYNNTKWLGIETQKCPLDMWTFQEILFDTKPDVLVEAGTFLGGSAYYFASMFDLLRRGRVVTIDIENFKGKPVHDRITYLLGSSTSDEIVSKVRSAIAPGEKVMVVLDSNHSRDHVRNELRLYSGMVSPGCYLIVEDTHFNGHPILPKWGPGPWEAVEEFLAANKNFERDRSRERFLLTFNPGGWLKRVR
jgi:cephalosporin hydroxylase